MGLLKQSSGTLCKLPLRFPLLFIVFFTCKVSTKCILPRKYGFKMIFFVSKFEGIKDSVARNSIYLKKCMLFVYIFGEGRLSFLFWKNQYSS